MKIQEKTDKIKRFILQNPVGLYLMASLIPLNPKLLSYGIVVIVLETFIRRKHLSVQNFKDNLNLKNPGLWLGVFYIIHLFGLLFTENMKFASMDLGMKASFILFPVLFMFYKPKIDWNVWIKFFVFGAIISVVYNFYNSYTVFALDNDFRVFLGVHFSHLMHRGYWATYLTIALFFVLKMMIQTKKTSTISGLIFIAILFIVSIVMSESKIGVIILFLLLVWGVFQLLKKLSKKKRVIVSSLVLFGGIVLIFAIANSRLSERFSKTLSAVSISFEDLDKESTESTTLRLFTWYSSVQLIQENFWFGVGTGDIKDELIQRNKDNGFVKAAEQQLNSHNQFLNSHIALGIFGSLSLLFVFVFSVLKSPNKEEMTSWKRWIVLIFFISFLTESFLEVQAGIIPFAFIICLLHSMELKEKSMDSKTVET